MEYTLFNCYTNKTYICIPLSEMKVYTYHYHTEVWMWLSLHILRINFAVLFRCTFLGYHWCTSSHLWSLDCLVWHRIPERKYNPTDKVFKQLDEFHQNKKFNPWSFSSYRTDRMKGWEDLLRCSFSLIVLNISKSSLLFLPILHEHFWSAILNSFLFVWQMPALLFVPFEIHDDASAWWLDCPLNSV